MKTANQKLSKLSFEEVAERIVSSQWNSTTRDGAATKILKHIYPNKNFDSLHEFLLSEKKRMKDYDFDIYYGGELLDLVTMVKESSNNEWFVNVIIQTMKKDYSLKNRFHWDNLNYLHNEGMLNLLGDFDTDFRGTIKNIHKVYNNKYIVIECERDGENNFYYCKENRLEVYCFNDFEHALFYAMVGDKMSSGMIAIYEYSKKDK